MNCNKKSLNIQEMLANSKVNTLWNGFRIKNDANELVEFFDNLQNNNDLLLIFKSMERFCSLYGSAYIFFDIDENKRIHLGVYVNNVANQIAKIDGLVEYAGVGVRIITITKTGTQISVKECRTANETQVIPYSGTSIPRKYLPIDTFTITLPEKINELGKPRIIKHNYGVLSMKQILNKNIIDWEFNENVLPDNASVKHLEPIINDCLNYINDEQELNKTRVFGQFSNQDIEKVAKTPKTMESLLALQKAGLVDSTLVDDFYNRIYTPEQKIASSRLFFNTNGGANAIDIMKGDIDIEKLTNGLNVLIETYFNGAGMSYQLGKSSNSASVKSIQEIQAQQRTTYETIKMTNTLRKQQLEEFIERIMIAYGLEPNLYKGRWNIEIISNILNSQDSDIDSIIKLYNSKLITQEEATKRANPNMNENDINAMLGELKVEKEKELVYNNTIDNIAQGNEKEVK